MTFVEKFLSDESGAVTVDWVVLTAAIVGMGTVVVTTIANGAMDTSTGLGATVGGIETQLTEGEDSGGSEES